MATEPCQNCDTPRTGPYCPTCGQRHFDNDRALLRVVGDWLAETFEADGRLARTLVPFFFQPGRLVSDYLAGRRARYTPPLRIYIFSVLISFFALSLLVHPEQWNAGEDPADFTINVGPDADADADADADGWVATLQERFRERIERLNTMPAQDAVRTVFAAFLDSAPSVLTLLVPVFALLLKLLYWRRYFVDHLLFSLVLHALALLLATLAGALATWTGSGWPVFFAVVALIAHLVLGLHRVYGGARWATALRTMVVFTVYPMALGMGTALSVVLAIWKT